jgi:hypothetical protein
MLVTLGEAVGAAVVVGLIAAAFAKPRAWMLDKARHWYWLAFRSRRERVDRAVARLAAEVIRLRGESHGLDNEQYLELLKWFTGDPEAHPDYAAMNDRVNERMRLGKPAYGDQDQIPL